MLHRQIAFIWCICTNFAALIYVSAQVHESNENNSNHTLPAYAIASRADLLNSTCGKELRDFRDAVDQRILWSLKMLDSSGGPKPGFFYGNNYWLGIRSQCQDTTNRNPMEISKGQLLNNSIYRNSQKEFPPFEVNYFVAYFRHNSTFQYHMNLPNDDLITLGLCLPASCSVNDLSFILERIFHDRVLLINNLYPMDFKLINVKDLKDDHQWLFSGAISFISVALMLIFSMTIIGTIYDVFVHQIYLKDKTNVKNIPAVQRRTLSSRQESRLGKILVCFSVYTNTKIIFNTRLGADSVPIVHGLRFITMIWIIMAHSVLYSADYLDNRMWTLRFAEGLPIQVLSNATISVDTFLFQSGFLLAYSYLKNERGKERTGPINYRAKLNEFFVAVIRRFIRLTPAYMTMIGILLLNSSWYDKTSQFYMDERPQEACAKYWWRNLLYINNLFDYGTSCMTWSWYLAIDMQYFVIGMALLILSTIYFYMAVAILSTLLIGSIMLAGYTSYVHEYVPTLDEQYKLLNVLYCPSWLRIGPYIIGIITGYILVRLNKKLILKRQILILCWCLAGACNICVLFGLYKRDISVLSTAIYIALSRTVWALGIAWVVIACSTKHGGIVKKLLSFKGWIPFSRLTYCAYLLNPFIIHSVSQYSETPAHLEFLFLGNMFMGYLMISYCCAYALSLIAETPYVLLMRMLIQSRDRRKHKHEIIMSHAKL